MDKQTMKQAIVNRLLNERDAGTVNPSQHDIAVMALEALDTIGALNHGAVTYPASQEAVDIVLNAPVDDEGRSDYQWLIIPGTGDVMLGVFPRGDTFFEVEALREADYKGSLCPAPDGPCTCTNGIGCVNTPYEKW